MKSLIKSFLVIFFLAISINNFAQDTEQKEWNQFRGFERNGAVSSVSINENWTEKAPVLRWKKEIGNSFSEVVTFNDKLFTTSSIKIDSISGNEYMLAINANTGETLWQTKIDSIFIDVDGFGDGTRSTPAIDQENIYILTSYGKFHALSMKDGSIIWTIDFVKEFESALPRWAFSTSPLIIGNELFIEIGGSESRGFASVNKKDGSINWVKGNATPYYSSPSVANINGVTNILFANDSMLVAFDTKGNKLWNFRMPLRFPTATPLFIAPNKVFVSSAGKNGGCLIEINKNIVNEIFTNTSMKNHFSSSCAHEGYIYGFSNSMLRCVSMETGEIKWSKMRLGKGTLIKVDDKLLVLSDKGVLKLVDTNPELYTELGSIQAIQGKSWTAPSFAKGTIYVRNLNEIAAYKLN